MGEPGTGKTFSCAMAAKYGMNVRFVFTEPGMDTITAESFPADVRNLVGKNIHWMYVPTANSDFKDMIQRSIQIGQLSFAALKDVQDSNRDKKTGEFIDILRALSEFKSDLTGENFGSCDTWGDDTILVLDSLSGVNVAALRLVVGNAPSPSQAQWGVAMQAEEALIQRLCMGPKCWFVLTAHTEVEADELTGGTRIMPGALGRKVAPKLGRFFSEVIETKVDVDGYYWSTKSNRAALKSRNLPRQEKMKPDFGPLIAAYRKGPGSAPTLTDIAQPSKS